jgi:hypothetical protein
MPTKPSALPWAAAETTRPMSSSTDLTAAVAVVTARRNGEESEVTAIETARVRPDVDHVV